MTTAFLFAILFGLLFLGTPIAISLGFASVLTILLFAQDSLASMSLAASAMRREAKYWVSA